MQGSKCTYQLMETIWNRETMGGERLQILSAAAASQLQIPRFCPKVYKTHWDVSAKTRVYF